MFTLTDTEIMWWYITGEVMRIFKVIHLAEAHSCCVKPIQIERYLLLSIYLFITSRLKIATSSFTFNILQPEGVFTDSGNTPDEEWSICARGAKTFSCFVVSCITFQLSRRRKLLDLSPSSLGTLMITMLAFQLDHASSD